MQQWCSNINFEVDTGAEVTAMSDITFHSPKNSTPQLKKSNQTLLEQYGSTLDVLGETTFKLTYKGKSGFERVQHH